jgi:SH3-like domain-containing protein
MKHLSLLVSILSVVALNLEPGIAGDKTISHRSKQVRCIEQLQLPIYGALRSQDANARINLREQPSTSTAVMYIGSPDTPVTIYEQTVGTDNNCWYRVELIQAPNSSGWVRGDLLNIYLDIPYEG